MEYKKGMTIKEYYENNREFLQRLAQSGDIVLRSMALAVIMAAEDFDKSQ